MDSEDVEVGTGSEVDREDEGKSVSEAVTLGGSVTVLAKLVVEVPVGSSESVEFADTVGNVALPDELAVGVIESVVFDSWVESVPDGMEEPLKKLLAEAPVWPAEPVAERLPDPVPDELPKAVDEVPRDPVAEPLAVPVGATLPDPEAEPLFVPVGTDRMLLMRELRVFADVGVADEPVPGPVGVPIVVNESVSVLVGLDVSVTPEITLLKTELRMLVGEAVEEPVPGPVGVPIVVATSVLVGLVVSVTPETTLLRTELSTFVSEAASEADVAVPDPVTSEIVEDVPKRSLVTLATPEVTWLTTELKIFVSELVVEVAATVVPVPGPVTPEVTEASLADVVAELSSVLEASVLEVSVLEASVLEASLVVVADEVTPVPAPVAVESIVLEVVAGSNWLVTSEIALLTSPETVLKRELMIPVAEAAVVAVEEPESVALSLSVELVDVASTDEVLSVEDTMIPLDVSATSVLEAVDVVEDGVTMP